MFRLELNQYTLKLFIDDLMHLYIKRVDLIGIQSWVDYNSGYYCIEYTLKNRDILTEYDDITKWKSIVKLLEEKIY